MQPTRPQDRDYIAEANKAIAEEQARIDLIRQLKECPAFEAYFLATLRERQKAVEKSVLTDESLTPEIREAMRLGAKEHTIILGMADSDMAAALARIEICQRAIEVENKRVAALVYPRPPAGAASHG